jgi:hypothetical protein
MRVAPLGPVAGAYYLNNSRVAVIEGPVGSGKSTASCLRLQRHTYEQPPGTDGVGRTRWAIVRNTKPQLRDTTMETWFNIFPTDIYGPWLERDATHTWSYQPRGHPWPIHSEFIFRALDDEKDVSNLLSLEVTGFWFNECREIVRDIIAHAGRRTRYLSGDRPTKWSGWIGDTNPWDTEHYLQEDLVTSPREGWAHFIQPGGMDPRAENLENLEQTEETLAMSYDDPRRREQGRTYYVKALQDYSPEDARVYVHAQRGLTRSGKPIYSDYSDTLHCREFTLDRSIPLSIGYDFGRTPAAVIGQQLPNARWLIADELCAFDMGVKKHGEMLKRHIANEYPGFEIGNVTGDPAGDARDAEERTTFDILKAVGITARPAKTNELSIRINAVNGVMRRLSDGQPSILIHPRCKMLRRACMDGYHYRKLLVTGNRYDDKPNKNDYSHVAEALQYLLLGGGEGREVLNKPLIAAVNSPKYALT